VNRDAAPENDSMHNSSHQTGTTPASDASAEPETPPTSDAEGNRAAHTAHTASSTAEAPEFSTAEARDSSAAEQSASNMAESYWNGRYSEWAAMWSGRVNPILAREASILTPGTVLDLGCGEGADAIWLANAGWKVTAIDVSTTALDRAREHAEAAGVGERIDWQHQDLAEGFPSGEFDLVSAQFLHSPIEMPRGEILRRAAAAVAPGGSLLVVGHFGTPPGAAAEHNAAQRHAAGHNAASHHVPGTSHDDMELPTPDEVLSDLNLPNDEWQTVVSELAARTVTAPDGTVRELVDSILRVQRRSR
jgi:2-polyprenyl-3-methyl-5-hydroxy-6-metoxy-1,4-benzoquinol methylase